eukprot:4610481-Alexandrium_andersonii.AAC.1
MMRCWTSARASHASRCIAGSFLACYQALASGGATASDGFSLARPWLRKDTAQHSSRSSSHTGRSWT